MKNRLVFTLLFAIVSIAIMRAQLPYTESFETGSGYTADVDVIDNFDDYFARMDTDCTGPPDPCAVNFFMGYTGFNGSFYWAGEDHDDPDVGGVATLCITLDAIDISSNTSGRINISMLAAANGQNNPFELANDGIFVTYAVDGGAFQPVHTWAYYSPDGGTTERLAYDEDNDGAVNGAESDILTGTFEAKDRDVDAVGTSLVIRICAHSEASSEEWAVDHIVVTSAAPLPVELTTFSAEAVEKGVWLDWQTASEVNNMGFDVQRSVDGKSWETIHFVEGHGDARQANTYRYFDPMFTGGALYYRLKQLDLDGSYAFSKVVTVQRDFEQIRIFPNPATDYLFVGAEVEERRFYIYNQLGELVRTPPFVDSRIDISNLSPGMYFLKLEVQGQPMITKIIKL
ncbi:MAG: T9SS type A sorting domain-containing protein [Bacteroidota bacterium]